MFFELKKYLPLFKLRICTLITFSAVVGFVATLSGDFSIQKMMFLIIATMLAATGSSAFTHYFDRDIDAVMGRTRKRPLPSSELAGSPFA